MKKFENLTVKISDMLKEKEELNKIREIINQLINLDNNIFMNGLIMTLEDKDLNKMFNHYNFKECLLNLLFYDVSGSKNNLEKIKLIVENYESIESYQKNWKYTFHQLLKGAANNGKLETVKYVLTTKLPINININVDDGYPLVFAAYNSFLDVVDYLLTSPDLKKHANIHANNDMAIYYAADSESHQNNQIIKYLLSDPKLKKHANPNNSKVGLPFHYACMHNNIELMETLWNTQGFDKELSLYSLNSEAQTILELACENTHKSEEAIIFLATVCNLKPNKVMINYINKNLTNENVIYYMNYLDTIKNYEQLSEEISVKNDTTLPSKRLKI